MIRLLIRSEEPKWYSPAIPLRGATVTFSRAGSGQPAIADADAVAFVQREQFSADEVQRVVESGKHVLVAADACSSQQTLSSLISEGKSRNGSAVKIAVLNPVQYLPSRKLIRERLESGKLGVPGLVRLHSWRRYGNDDKPMGVPLPLLCDLEFAISLFRERPGVLYAVQSEGTESLSGNYVQVHLGFRESGMALIDCTNRLPAGNDYASLNVIGSLGAAYSDDLQNTQLLLRGGPPQALRVDESLDQCAVMLQEFVDRLTAKEGFSAPLQAWSDAIEVASAVMKSLDERRSVSLSD